MKNQEDINVFGTGECEDVNAVSDEMDRPCPESPLLEDKVDATSPLVEKVGA